MTAVANVAINVDSRDASRKLREVANRSKEVSKAAGTASYNVQRLGIAFRSTVAPLVALTGAATFLNRSLNLLGRRQADVAALANGLQKIGEGEGALRRLQKTADALGKATLFDQEDFDAGFTLLTSFRKIGVSTYERVARAAADVAQVTGQDVRSSLMQLSKALEDPSKRVTDLARSGTVFTEQQKEQIKVLQESGRLIEAQNLILSEIEAQYGGAAEAAGKAGYAGAVDSLGESFRDFQETIANVAEPAVVALLGTMTKLFDSISSIPEPAGRMALEIGAVTAAVVLLTKSVNIFMGSQLASFLGTQIALYKAFGAQIYLTAAAQTALNGLLTVGKALMLSLPVAAVTLAVVGLADALRQAATDQQSFNKLLNTGTVEQLKNALATEQANLALAKRMELQGRGEGRAADSSRIKRSQTKIQQLEAALAEGALGGGSLPATQPIKLTSTPSKKDDSVADKLKKQLAAGRELSVQFERQNQLLNASSSLQQSLLQIEFKRLDAIKRIKETAAASQQQELIASANKNAEIEKLKKIEKFAESELQAADDLIKATYGQIEAEKRREELISEGIDPALADELVKIEQTFDAVKEKLDLRVLDLEAQLALVDATSEEAKKLQEVIDKIKEKQRLELGKTEEDAKDNAKEKSEDEKAKEKAEKLKKIMEDLRDNAIASVAQALEDALVTTIEKAITGAEDLGESLKAIASNLLGDLGRMFIRAGLQGLMPVPGRAVGGPVQSNGTYLVGERGPELLSIGNQSGYVHRNTSEAMDRYRAGESSGGGSRSLNVNYNVTQINGMNFVTEEQFRVGMTKAAKDGAKMGEAGTFKSMRNSRSSRARVGL